MAKSKRKAKPTSRHKPTLSPDKVVERLDQAYESSLTCYDQLLLACSKGKRTDKKILDGALLEGESAIGLATKSPIPSLLRKQRDKVGKGTPACGKIDAKTWIGLAFTLVKLLPDSLKQCDRVSLNSCRNNAGEEYEFAVEAAKGKRRESSFLDRLRPYLTKAEQTLLDTLWDNSPMPLDELKNILGLTLESVRKSINRTSRRLLDLEVNVSVETKNKCAVLSRPPDNGETN